MAYDGDYHQTRVQLVIGSTLGTIGVVFPAVPIVRRQVVPHLRFLGGCHTRYGWRILRRRVGIGVLLGFPLLGFLLPLFRAHGLKIKRFAGTSHTGVSGA